MRERIYALSSISSEFDEIDELNEIIERTLYEFGDFYRQNYEIIVSRLIYCLLQCKCLINNYSIQGIQTFRGIKIICGNNLLRSNEILIRYKGDGNMGIDLRGLSFSNIYFRNEKKLPDKVMFNKKKGATTLLFDDEVIVVKKNKNDKEDYEKAFLWAYFIKKSGLSKTQASKYIDKIMEENK